MPYCSRIDSFYVTPSSNFWSITIRLPLDTRLVNFGAVLQHSILGTRLVREEFLPAMSAAHQLQFLIPKKAICEDALQRFLRILKWTVTISDDADESHALYIHTLPHPTQDPYEPNWQRTRIGNLVYTAKSYSPSTGSKPAAADLSERMAYWIRRHPRYRSADVIISAPAGNPCKGFDLPASIVAELSQIFGFRIASCTIIGKILQQKTVPQDIDTLRSNVGDKFRVKENLLGENVIVVDDIYQSGETLRELTRACREAGAKSVLSLAASKTAKFCNGLPPHEWLEVSMEAEQASE